MLGGAARIAAGSLFLPQRMGAMSKSIFCGLSFGHGRAFSILGSGVVRRRSSISSLLGRSSSGRVMTVAMRGEWAPTMGRCPAALVSFRSVSSGGGPAGGGAGGGAGDGGAGQQQRRENTGGGGDHVGKEQEQLHMRMAAKRAREEAKRARIKSTVWYMLGVTCFTISMTYASVPLYRIFCQKTGFAGTVKDKDDVKYEEKAKPVSGKRMIKIKFNSDVSTTLPWSFAPQQHSVNVVPGEACLAFYTAHNKTKKPIVGVSTYNVQPEGAALYFNKIQCFCFEEQMLHPNEKIDMPVFFFIDPDIMNDRTMDYVDTITLSYTFFKVGDADAPDIAGLLVPAHPPRAGAKAGVAQGSSNFMQ